ncbi:MAG: OsmC family protein [Ferruginibacter sp.]
MDNHHIISAFTHGMSFTSDINGHKLITDTTVDGGGNDLGPSPKRLMLVALAGCTGIDVVSILNKMKVTFSDFSIDIKASLTESHPRIYNEVHIRYKIKTAISEQEKMEKAVRLSEEKYCGVSAMFRAFATVKHEIIFD